MTMTAITATTYKGEKHHAVLIENGTFRQSSEIRYRTLCGQSVAPLWVFEQAFIPGAGLAGSNCRLCERLAPSESIGELMQGEPPRPAKNDKRPGR